METWERAELSNEPVVDVDVHLFLDKSASMKSDWPQTVEGVQEYFSGINDTEQLRNHLHLVAFGSVSESVFKNQTTGEFKKESISVIRPDGRSTSLYDSVGSYLASVKSRNPINPQLIIVFTDGKDNSSQVYTAKSVAALRDELEAKGNYTFVFMGASPDVWEEGKTLANSGSMVNFNKSAIKSEFSKLSQATASYGATVSMDAGFTRSVTAFYADVDDDSFGAKDTAINAFISGTPVNQNK